MSGRATAVAAANIAFVKYWGTKNLKRTLPFDPSISMTLSNCVSRCTVEVAPLKDGVRVLVESDEVGSLAPAGFAEPIERHLERIRRWAGREPVGFVVSTRNNFPTGAGLASSASGFSALTMAAVAALGREVSVKELSSLARLSGSGSAARSVLGGYVEWPAGPGEDGGHAVEIAPASHWDLRDLVAVVDSTEKGVSSRDGHRRAPTSPYFKARRKLLPARLEQVRRSIRMRDFAALAKVVEEEAIDLHLIAMSSCPPIFYWRPQTLDVLAMVRELRADGIEACATMDAGPNVHVICTPAAEPLVARELAALPGVTRVIADRVGEGPRLIAEGTN